MSSPFKLLKPFTIDTTQSFTFANVTTSGNITATNANLGNAVVANYFVGNGSLLTGLPASYSDSNVAAYLPTYTGNISAGNIITTGTSGNISGANYIAANFFVGDGSNVTNVNALTLGGHSASYFATSTQGSKADSAVQPGANVSVFTNDAGYLVQANLSTYATQSYVNSAVSNLVNSAPAILDTLGELANAIGNDANFVTTITTDLAGKFNSSDFNSTANSWLSLQTTSNVAEGTNLYYTVARANTAIDNRVTKSFIDNLGVISSSTDSVQGGNVTGQVSNSLIAGTVYTNAQPNITSVGTLTSLIVAGNITTTGTSGNISGANFITANYFVGDGSLLTGLPASYSNTNVAAYLPTYTGNVAAGNLKTDHLLYANGSPYVFTSVPVTVSTTAPSSPSEGDLWLDSDTGEMSVYFGGAWASVVSSTSTSITVTGNAQPNITSVGTLTNLEVSGNITASYLIGNGSQLTGLPASYANANVAAYLPTYTGNISAGNIITTGTSGNISGANFITANYFVGDGSLLTGLPASYANSNVVAWFATQTTSNLTEGTNLYFTDTRANTAITNKVTKSFVDALGINANTINGHADTYFATSTQGTKADSAVQPGANVSVLTNDAGYLVQANLSTYATQTYVNTQVTNLINSAPSALDTLNELANALGNDASFSTTITNSLANKLSISAFNSTANIWLTLQTTSNVAEGTNLYYTVARANTAIDDRVTKTFVDNLGVNATTLNGHADTYFATSTQGSLADSAVQPGDLATVATSGSYTDLIDKPALFDGTYANLTGKPILGTAASTNANAYATAAQGTKADTAIQSGANISVFTNDSGYLVSANLSGYATESYVGNAVANLVASAPAALDTLNELANALGNDASYSTTITNALANKLNISAFNSTANTWLTLQTTSNVAEGTNLYYTVARANTAIDDRVTKSFVDTLSVVASSANSVQGGNVTGQVGNALIAGTVYSNAQPNITSVGSLSSLTVTGTLSLNDISKLYVPGGTANYVLQTNGSGSLSWTAPPVAGNAYISGSNTQLFFNNGSTTLGASANLTFNTGTNTLTTPNLVVNGTTNMGAIGNVTITGGSSNNYLKTDGSGTLSWATLPTTSVTLDSFTGNGTSVNYTLSVTPTSANYTLISVAGIMQPKTTYSLAGNVITFSEAPPQSAPIEVTTINSGVSAPTSGGGSGYSYQGVSANTTLAVATRYIVNTSASALTLTLPSTANLGDEIGVIDGTGNAATNNITINPNGENIMGAAGNMIISTTRAAFTLVYYNASQGWLLTQV